MAVAETIVARSDPYTVVIIPNIRVAAAAGVIDLSVGQLARVEYAEITPGGIRTSPALSFATSALAMEFFTTSGSGNIVTMAAFGYRSTGTMPVPTSAFLSACPLYLKAWGR